MISPISTSLLIGFLATFLSAVAAAPAAYRVQGFLQYKLFDPPKVGPVTPAHWQDFQETSYFDLEVSNCLFHAVIVKEWQDPGILYYEVGTDGTNIYQQTVFSSKIDTERVMVPRSDGTWKEIQRARAKPSANDSAGQVHPGAWPKDRGFHESILWFALASQCALPHAPTETTTNLPRLWEYGDNYVDSYMSRSEVVIKSLGNAPFLPAVAAYLGQEPSKTYDFPKYTNVLYSVSSTLRLGELELPREFTLYYGEESGHSTAGARGEFQALTLFKGVVTNAVHGVSRPHFVPLLSSRALVMDNRFYERENQRLVPVTRLVSHWNDIANAKTNIPFREAFPQLQSRPDRAPFAGMGNPMSAAGTPRSRSRLGIKVLLGGGILVGFLVAIVWLREKQKQQKGKT